MLTDTTAATDTGEPALTPTNSAAVTAATADVVATGFMLADVVGTRVRYY